MATKQYSLSGIALLLALILWASSLSSYRSTFAVSRNSTFPHQSKCDNSPHTDLTEVLPPNTDHKVVLVTGAAGFIGSHVAEALLKRGDNVIIVDEVNDYYDPNIKECNLHILETKYGKDRVKIYRGDICNKTFIQAVFQETNPQWICHLAARAGVRPSIIDPFLYIHSNIGGTTQLLEMARSNNVKNFVFASSSSVYGGLNKSIFTEGDSVDNPISPYAASKLSCELLAYTYHNLYNLSISALRFFTVYGPRGRPDMAPAIFIDRISQGRTINQYGDGSSSRDYTYIDDIVHGVVRAIDRPYAYEIFNLGKGAGTSLKEFIHIVEQATGKNASLIMLPDQPGDVPYTRANVAKARRLLGFEANVSFQEGIQKTVNWYNKAKQSNKCVE